MCISSRVSIKTVRQELYRVNIHGQAAIAKPLVTRANAKHWFQCCLQWKWTMRNMYCSLSPPSLSVPYLGKLRCGEATKKLTTRTVACPEWSMGVDQWRFELQYHCTHYRPNTWAKDYRTILEGHVYSMVKALYPEGGAMYQDVNVSKHTARLVTVFLRTWKWSWTTPLACTITISE